MNAPNKGMRGWRLVFDYTPFANTSKGLRGWWLTPPRSGIYRVIAPWAYRHLRFSGAGAIAGGVVAAAAGFICLAYSAYGMAAFFLVVRRWVSRAATGTSLSIAPHVPEPEPGRTPAEGDDARTRGPSGRWSWGMSSAAPRRPPAPPRS